MDEQADAEADTVLARQKLRQGRRLPTVQRQVARLEDLEGSCGGDSALGADHIVTRMQKLIDVSTWQWNPIRTSTGYGVDGCFSNWCSVRQLPCPRSILSAAQ